MPIQYITLKNDTVLVENAEVLGITKINNGEILKQGVVRLITSGMTAVAVNDRIVYRADLKEEGVRQNNVSYTIVALANIRFVYTEPIL